MELNLLDVDKVCRVCLCSDQELFLIFDEKYKNAEDHCGLAAMLSECTSYKVERFDDLPHLICGVCMAEVRNAFQFKRKCEKSYRKLVGILSANNSKGNNSDSRKWHSISDPIDGNIIKSEECATKSTQTDNTTLYPCERCEEKYFTLDDLRAHRDNEHKGSAIECRYCSKIFNRVGYLKAHIAVLHPESGYISHNQCHVCLRQFTRRAHMRRHLSVVHKIVEIADDMQDMETTNIHEKLLPEVVSEVEESIETSQTEPHSNESIMQKTILYSDQEDKSPMEQSESEGEDRTGNLNHQPFPLNSDDEDEKPLSNLITRSRTKGFIEVLLNESLPDNKIIGNMENDTKNINFKCERSLTPPSKRQVDVLSPCKRGRGRPPRIVKDFSSSEELEYKCEVCDKTFEDRAALQKHISSHADGAGKKFPCQICAKIFIRAENLKSHMHNNHGASKIMKCDECDKVFSYISQYKRHKETKHCEKAHKCEICQKRFTTKIYLQRHMFMHDKKRYICKECSQSYVTKEELNAHIKAEGHNKPMLCPECGLRCKTSNILMVHMRRHNGEKPFKCKFCSKGFPRMDDLRIHEKYHTGEKSHFCETCGKGFQRKYNLTIHLRVHTGEKPYKCPHCPQAFAQGNDLKAHIRRHTGERFRCEVCGAAFLQGYQIRQHKLTEHGIKEDPPTQRVAKFMSPEEQEQQIKQNLQRELSETVTTSTDWTTSMQTCEAISVANVSTTTEATAENIQDFMNT